MIRSKATLSRLISIFTIVVFCHSLNGQAAMDLWEYMQTDDAHLHCDCAVKKVYYCNTDSACYLLQEQQFSNNLIVKDIMFGMTGDTVFNLSFDKSAYPQLVLSNQEDGRSSEYFFTSSDRLRYFVQSENTNRFMVYTYTAEGHLRSIKHCMDPTGNHRSCLYYQFNYQDQGMVSAKTYLLENTMDTVQLDHLIQADSFEYDSEGRLMRIQTFNERAEVQSTYSVSERLLKSSSIIEKKQTYSRNDLPKSYRYQFFDQEKNLISEENGVYIKSDYKVRRKTYYKNGQKVKVVDYDDQGQRQSFYIIRYQ